MMRFKNAYRSVEASTYSRALLGASGKVAERKGPYKRAANEIGRSLRGIVQEGWTNIHRWPSGSAAV